MPSPSACSTARALRSTYRRLWWGAAVGGGIAVLGVLPLAYLLPMPAWQQTALGALCLLYLGSKTYALRTASRAERQLRLESCFIGHSFDGHQLRRCLRRRGHLWTHSYTVRALRRLTTRPLANVLLAGQKHERVREEYQHALKQMRASHVGLALPLAGLLAGFTAFCVLTTAPLLAPWLLSTAPAALLLIFFAEGLQAVCRYRVRHLFERLVAALADWTLARSVRDLLQGRQPASYRHTALYRACAWFARPAPGRPPTAGSSAAGTAPAPPRTAA